MDKIELQELLDNYILDNELIKYIYDTNLNMTLSELSRITNKSISELKFILTCTEEEY